MGGGAERPDLGGVLGKNGCPGGQLCKMAKKEKKERKGDARASQGGGALMQLKQGGERRKAKLTEEEHFSTF